MDGLEHEQLMQFYKYSIEKEVELVWWRDAGGISENSGVNLCTYSIYIYICALYLKAKTSRFSVLMSFKQTACPHIISPLKVCCSEKQSTITFTLVKSQISITQISLFMCVCVCVCVCVWETD